MPALGRSPWVAESRVYVSYGWVGKRAMYEKGVALLVVWSLTVLLGPGEWVYGAPVSAGAMLFESI